MNNIVALPTKEAIGGDVAAHNYFKQMPLEL